MSFFFLSDLSVIGPSGVGEHCEGQEYRGRGFLSEFRPGPPLK